MAKFFLRSDKKTIESALQMTEDEFVKAYSDTTATELTLRKAHKDLNKENKLPAARSVGDGNGGTTKTQPVKGYTADDGDKVNISKVGDTTVVEIESKTDVVGTETETEEASGGKKVKKKKEKKPRKEGAKVGGFVKTAEGEKRDARILELLKEGKPVKQVLEIMKGEGFTIHGPQVYAIKGTM